MAFGVSRPDDGAVLKLGIGLMIRLRWFAQLVPAMPWHNPYRVAFSTAALLYIVYLPCYFYSDYRRIQLDHGVYEKRVSVAIQLLPNSFRNINCDALVNGSASPEEVSAAQRWTYRHIPDRAFTFLQHDERCTFVKYRYGFNEEALSDEEKQYPLAYGILVHSSADQVFYMLSAIYQPQNMYCIAVDGSASEAFRISMEWLQDCLPNVAVMKVPAVRWCTYTVLLGVHLCLQYLASSSNKWRYFQYLSGVDLPLKTNHEMVRIFKMLNGSINAEVKPFQIGRLKGSLQRKPVPYGAALFKSSLSATISRESANFVAKSEEARQILHFLEDTNCPDESFWVTMAGNKGKIPMPGSFNATRFLETTATAERRARYERRDSSGMLNYYISRYQTWKFSKKKSCNGIWRRMSCVFGVKDISTLLAQPHLVAHKFYLTVQPAAYFCVYKKIRERAVRSIDAFNDEPYGDLPGPRMTRGESVQKWFQKYYSNSV